MSESIPKRSRWWWRLALWGGIFCLAMLLCLATGWWYVSAIMPVPEPVREVPALAFLDVAPIEPADALTSPTLAVAADDARTSPARVLSSDFITDAFPKNDRGFPPRIRMRAEGMYLELINRVSDYRESLKAEQEGRTREFMASANRFNELAEIHIIQLGLGNVIGEMEDQDAWMGELSPKTAKMFRLERVKEIEDWVEAEMERVGNEMIAQQGQADFVWTVAALRLGYYRDALDPQRAWQREVAYWRRVGGLEGHYRIGARWIEYRYDHIQNRLAGSKIGQILPARLDLD